MSKKDAPIILRNAGSEAPSLWFYEEFGPDDYGYISANAVRSALANIGTTRKLEVHYNSEGGDIYQAGAIYNLLKNSGAKIISMIDGMAVSCASWVAQSGDEIHMAENALMMIHNPVADAFGWADVMDSTAAALRTVKNSIANVYSKRKGKMTVNQVSDAMDVETWYTAQQALDCGLIDTIDENKSITMRSRRQFKNAPDWIREIEPGDYRKYLQERRQQLNEMESFELA